MNSVWILSRGENGEGSEILRVYATKPKSKQVLSDANRGRVLYFKTWVKSGTNRWESGCDFLELKKYKVK